MAAFLVAGYVAIDLGQTVAVGWGPMLAMALVWFLAMAIWPPGRRSPTTVGALQLFREVQRPL
jgi:hypothetical protein